MDFRCHHEIIQDTPNGICLDTRSVGSSSLTADPIPDHARPDDGANAAAPGSVTLSDALATFRTFAVDAISSGDPAELHNAAMEAARKWNLTSSVVRRVLAVIGRERPEFRKVAAEWHDEDAGRSKSLQRHLSDEELNQILARHAIETDWDNASVARELYHVQILAIQLLFHNRLPLAVLSFKATANGSRSSLRIDRNGLGVKHEININLTNTGESRAIRAAYVIHELLHLYEALFECREPTGNYHCKRFLVQAAELGIPTTPSGTYLGVTADSPVERLLKYLGIPRDDEGAGEGIPGSGGSRPKRSPPKVKLFPWNCGCTEIYAPIGVVIEGRCLKPLCGGLWKPSLDTKLSAAQASESEDTPSSAAPDGNAIVAVT